MKLEKPSESPDENERTFEGLVKRITAFQNLLNKSIIFQTF